MKSFLLLSLIAILASTMTACASNATVQIDTSGTTIQLSMPGPNPLVNQPDAQGRVARSLAGLWHGFILPFTVVISFFSSDVQIYEVHNAGSEYNFGFFLGEAFMFGMLALFLRIRHGLPAGHRQGRVRVALARSKSPTATGMWSCKALPAPAVSTTARARSSRRPARTPIGRDCCPSHLVPNHDA